jgi:hypothetical protein
MVKSGHAVQAWGCCSPDAEHPVATAWEAAEHLVATAWEAAEHLDAMASGAAGHLDATASPVAGAASPVRPLRQQGVVPEPAAYLRQLALLRGLAAAPNL